MPKNGNSMDYNDEGDEDNKMVKPIVKDVFFLRHALASRGKVRWTLSSEKSEPATKADLQVGRDLQDTLKAHRAECVGMAANMREQ